MKPANLSSEQVTPLPAAVAEIGKIHFEGNIIPHQWYQHVRLESGLPDLPAITILAEIIYWYRPYQTLTKGGRPILHKHFDGDMFQCTAAYFESKFGLTKDQTRKALKRLEDGGYIRREYRDIVQQGILRNNIMFIEPVPATILSITHPAKFIEATAQQATHPSPVGDTLSPTGDTLSPTGDTLSPTGDIIKGIKTTTEISTETTTTTTTPNPSSNDTTEETEPVCGRRRGVEDQNLQPQENGQEAATLEITEEKMVIQEEIQTAAAAEECSDTAIENQNQVTSDEEIEEQRPELSFPSKLTESEYADIATQVYLFPTEVAQQMLDVIDAKIKTGQIRTSPAAVLRGIVRKYRADPTSFDPSTGFQVADIRRRRREAEARARAEADRRAKEREVLRAMPSVVEIQRQSIASMLRSLRGY